MIDKKDCCECYNIWNQIYDTTSLIQEISSHFDKDKIKFFDDVTGNKYSGNSETLCVVVEK